MNFFRYLQAVISNADAASSHRFALVVSVLALGVSTVILSIAACWGQNVDIALGMVSAPLAGLGGFVYGKAQSANSGATDGS